MAGSDDVIVVRTGGGTRRVRLADSLDASRAEQAEREANAWVKSLRGIPVDGVPLRERFTHRGDSLWWFAELYLHKMRVANEIHRALLALEALVGRERPTAMGVAGGTRAVRVLARRVAERDGIAWLGGTRQPARDWLERAGIVWRGRAYMARAAGPRRGRGGGRPLGQAAVAAFVHAAFWHGREEQYIGPVLRELEAALPAGDVALVGLGPDTSYKARPWHYHLTSRKQARAPKVTVEAFASGRALLPGRELWRRRRSVFASLRASRGLREAAVIRGCDAWPLVEPALMGIAYLQFPWSACVMDQLGAALDALKPSVALTYAEAGGWGRALVLESRRRGIASVGLQHGFIYRHWLNYLHEADEMEPAPGNPADRGFPYPTLTLLYDEFAAEHLARAGRIPPRALAVTGSSRLDALVERAAAITPDDMDRTRRAVGAGAGDALVVVAAKFSQIGPVFEQLVREAGEIPGVRLVVKPHPAEAAAPYLAAGGGAPHLTIAPAREGLADLIRVSRLLVTVNSTAAIEAMVMGVPSLVLGLPNNLTPFVEAGAMSGVEEGEPIGPALRALLADEGGRRAVLERSAAFMRRYRVESDGRAALRAAERIAGLAAARGGPGEVS
ncbi:MAG TPA: hypothetical protein PLE61_05160 [Vicinamibacterales bacterium]|nr:hypothetical protein [Vicinamibacterales bacterium]HPW20187.1 hypothetical protein [Vicinamibacterales bacterium]